MVIQKKKRVSRNIAGLKATFRGKKFLAYNTGSFFRQHYPEFRTAYSLIRKNFSDLHRGATVSFRGVTLVSELTGSYWGREKRLALKASIAGRDFFVIVYPRHAKERLMGVSLTLSFLKKMKNKIAGFNVFAIQPHFSYERNSESWNYLVTDFLPRERVTQVQELQGSEGTTVRNAIEQLKKAAQKEGLDVSGMNPENAFFEPKTNSLLLFDLVFEGELH